MPLYPSSPEASSNRPAGTRARLFVAAFEEATLPRIAEASRSMDPLPELAGEAILPRSQEWCPCSTERFAGSPQMTPVIPADSGENYCSEAPMRLPRIIQGGMGVGISNWRLARAVSRLGQLGVVSGTALDQILARRLQDGDPGGWMRRGLARFPAPELAARVWDTYYRAGGKSFDL